MVRWRSPKPLVEIQFGSTRLPSSPKLKTDAKVFVCKAVGIVDNAGGAEILTPGLYAFDVGVGFLETLKVLYLMCFNLHHIPSL